MGCNLRSFFYGRLFKTVSYLTKLIASTFKSLFYTLIVALKISFLYKIYYAIRLLRTLSNIKAQSRSFLYGRLVEYTSRQIYRRLVVSSASIVLLFILLIIKANIEASYLVYQSLQANILALILLTAWPRLLPSLILVTKLAILYQTTH